MSGDYAAYLRVAGGGSQRDRIAIGEVRSHSACITRPIGDFASLVLGSALHNTSRAPIGVEERFSALPKMRS